jgi:hypothetical protein
MELITIVKSFTAQAPRLYNYTFTGVITFLVVSVFYHKSIPLAVTYTLYTIVELITTVKSFTVQAPRLYNYTFTGVITYLVVSVFCSKSITLTVTNTLVTTLQQ